MNTLCAKCGACSTVCPVFQVTGREELSARGRLHLLGKMAAGSASDAYREIFSRCLLCGACKNACPRKLDIPAQVVAARQDLPRLGGRGSFGKLLTTRCLGHPALLSALADLLKISSPVLRQLPADSGLRLKLGLLLAPGEQSGAPDPEPFRPLTTSRRTSPGEVTIFAGCLARHLRPEIGTATGRLLNAGERPSTRQPEGQSCCGLAAYSAGDLNEACRLARHNLEVFAATTGPVVTPCGSCFSHLQRYPELLAGDPEYQARARDFLTRLREMSSFLGDSPLPAEVSPRPGAAERVRIFYHDPCHLRFIPGMCEAPRRLLRSRPGVELVELADGPRCCGLGGTFNLTHPELSERIAGNLVSEIRELTPDLVLTSCSGCLLQLQREFARSGEDLPVHHLATFLAET